MATWTMKLEALIALVPTAFTKCGWRTNLCTSCATVPSKAGLVKPRQWLQPWLFESLPPLQDLGWIPLIDVHHKKIQVTAPSTRARIPVICSQIVPSIRVDVSKSTGRVLEENCYSDTNLSARSSRCHFLLHSGSMRPIRVWYPPNFELHYLDFRRHVPCSTRWLFFYGSVKYILSHLK